MEDRMVDEVRRLRVYVLGVDPGTTTGLALALFTPDGPTAMWSDQLAWDEAADELARRLEQLRHVRETSLIPAVAVAERFTINAHTAQRGQQGAEDAMGMLGVLRREARLTGIELAPLQQASTAKNLAQDQTLRKLGLYSPNMVHANDAYRHCVAYALKTKALSPRLIVERPDA